MSEKIAYQSIPAKIFGLRFWIKNTQPDVLKKSFDNLLLLTNFNVLSFSEHFFPTQGYTAIWLLAESHLAIHTFPQHGWSYVELSGCNPKKTAAFKKEIEKNLDIERVWETHEMTASFPEGFSDHSTN